MGLSLGSHGCVTLECCLHEAPAPRLITFYFCQECWCAQSPWKCVGRIFVKYLLKNLLVCPEKNFWGPQKQMGFCPKYVFCVFLVGMCQEHSLWINIQPCSIPVLSWGLWGVLSPCSTAGGWICTCGLDFLPGLIFLTRSGRREERRERISLAQGKEIINNSGVRMFLCPIPQ